VRSASRAGPALMWAAGICGHPVPCRSAVARRPASPRSTWRAARRCRRPPGGMCAWARPVTPRQSPSRGRTRRAFPPGRARARCLAMRRSRRACRRRRSRVWGQGRALTATPRATPGTAGTAGPAAAVGGTRAAAASGARPTHGAALTTRGRTLPRMLRWQRGCRRAMRRLAAHFFLASVPPGL